MMTHRGFFFCGLMLQISLCSAHAPDELSFLHDEEHVYEEILVHNNYNKHIRAVDSARNRTGTVQFGVDVQKIVQLDEKSHVFVVELHYIMAWTDPRLRWNTTQYPFVKQMALPRDEIWVPDISLYNIASGMPDPRHSSLVVVSPAGRVLWIPHVTTYSYCAVDMSKFPLDTQVCNLEFGSWVHHGFKLDIQVNEYGATTHHLQHSAQWQVKSVTASRQNAFYECCPEPYPTVTVSFTLERSKNYVRYMLYYPGTLLSLMTCLVFALPPASQEKITLGILIFIGYCILLENLLSFLPEDTASMPIIGKYYTFSMFITALSLLFSSWVLSMQHRGPRTSKLHAVLRKILLGGLHRIVCVDVASAMQPSDQITYRPLQERIVGEGDENSNDRARLIELLEDLKRQKSSVHHLAETEWRLAAIVLDRCFLLIYLGIFIIGTIAILAA